MFATTPEPPYTAVIFTSTRTSTRSDGDRDHAATAAAMEELGRAQPGHLGLESARDPATGLGITVSYWATEADARAWKAVAAHCAAQRRGATDGYADYRVRVARVHRDYGAPGRSSTG